MRRFAILTAGAALMLGSLAIPDWRWPTAGRRRRRKARRSRPRALARHDDRRPRQGPRSRQGRLPQGLPAWLPPRLRRQSVRPRRLRLRRLRRRPCYGGDGPGSRCDRYGCGYGDPGTTAAATTTATSTTAQPPQYDCSRYIGPDGKPAQDPQCRYDSKCDCYYHSSQPTPQAGAPACTRTGSAACSRPGWSAGARPGAASRLRSRVAGSHARTES